MTDRATQSVLEKREETIRSAGISLVHTPNDNSGDVSCLVDEDVYTDLTIYLGFAYTDEPGALVVWELSEGTIFVAELAATSAGIEFRCTLQTTHGGFPVRFPMHLVDKGASPEVVVRYTGSRLDLLLFGVVVHQFGVATGHVVGSGSKVTLSPHAEASSLEQFHLWNRALNDDEIESLFHEWGFGQDGRLMVLRNQEKAWQKAVKTALHARHRPRFHVLPEANWINDPNGMIAWNGSFHVFYQHNPFGPYWGTMHWGHVESKDLVFWTHRPIALRPEWNTPDRDGCFSGCCVKVDGKPVIFYTAVYPEVQCAAISHDGLLSWRKLESNPLVKDPPYGEDTAGFRDPWVWREANGVWSMIVGSGRKSTGGAIPLFRGTSPFQWEYAGDILAASSRDEGSVWECPGLICLGEKHLLIYSPEGTGKVNALVGVYTDGKFIPEKGNLLDHGTNFYAPQATRDERGRVVMLGWVPPAADDSLFAEQCWAGCLTVPRLLELDDRGELTIRPIPELARLRQDHWSGMDQIAEVRSATVEILVSIKRGNAVRTILEVLRSPDGEEATQVVYDWNLESVQIVREKSSLDDRSHRESSQPASASPVDDELELHVFVDRSVVEVYANRRVTLTACVYPSRGDANRIRLRHEEGRAEVRALDVWSLASIWKTPEDQ